MSGLRAVFVGVAALFLMAFVHQLALGLRPGAVAPLFCITLVLVCWKGTR